MSLSADAVEAVEPPNSVPSNGRFATSSQNYAAGFPELDDPEWLEDAADRLAAERAAS